MPAEFTMRIYLKRAFEAWQAKHDEHPLPPWPFQIRANGEEFELLEIHSDFLLARRKGWPGAVLLQLSLLADIHILP